MSEIAILPTHYSFSLFVSTGSAGSDQAIQNLQKICEKLGEGRWSVEVVNVREDPARAERDRILAVPTLIKMQPSPALRIIGDLSDHNRVLNALGHFPAH